MKIAIAFASSILLCTSIAAAQMAPPTPMTAGQFANSAIGQEVILAVRVDRVARTQLEGELLERAGEGRYRPTRARVTLYVPADTPFVMGSFADLKPAAILFVYAVTTSAAHADVKKAIVVTRYVTIE